MQLNNSYGRPDLQNQLVKITYVISCVYFCTFIAQISGMRGHLPTNSRVIKENCFNGITVEV